MPGPPTPQISPVGQGPQSSRLPQPSPAGPHSMPWAAQVVGVQTGMYGVTHDPRSKIMNSSSFSCAVIGFESHSAGKWTFGLVLVLFTWKSLNSTRPHCASDCAPTGVLNVKCRGI